MTVVHLLQCDQCAKTADREGETLFWFEVYRTGNIRFDQEPDTWHLCSWACLADFSAMRAYGNKVGEGDAVS